LRESASIVPDENDNRRTAMLDAALVVIARAGSRGLTHRAVDRHLGLAGGSTSTYFRTRDALVSATVERMVELEYKAAQSVQLTAASHAEAAQLIATMIEFAVSPGNRDRELARFELGLEAARRPPLENAFLGGRNLLATQATRMLREAGCADPERTAPALALFINAIVLDRILHRDRAMIAPGELAQQIERFLDGC
jgi:DNA-binding transcriptional regulator YbjK